VTVALIWAQAANGVIGDHGKLPWHLPEDLRRFRSLTLGATVVMGRATWDSLPDVARPLPGRHNVVLTRRPGWTRAGATVAHSLAEAINLAPDQAWVIGGASVFREAIALADRIEVTELRDAVAGDAYAPPLGEEWGVTARDPVLGWLTSTTGLHYRLLSYAREDVRPA
jgi:dihydrofolate reductase